MSPTARRFAMTATATAVAAPAATFACIRRDLSSAGLAAPLIAWVAVEAFIALSRSYEAVVPRDRVVGVSRMLWLVSALYVGLDLRFGWTRVALPVAWGLVLAGVSLTGAGLRLWAVVRLGASFSYDVKRPAGGALIRTGPYRRIRHPAYLGLILVSTLPALSAGSLAGFAGLALTTLVATVRRLRSEEEMLEELFGESYRDYARGTWRLVPWVY